jgi:hypothetical protein
MKNQFPRFDPVIKEHYLDMLRTLSELDPDHPMIERVFKIKDLDVDPSLYPFRAEKTFGIPMKGYF